MPTLQCLKRSRMAKHEVLEKLLFRQISDGKWVFDEADDPCSISALENATAFIKQSRSCLDVREVRQSIGCAALLQYFPEFVVGYDYQNRVHFVCVHVQP
jgi:hypothetical protein